MDVLNRLRRDSIDRQGSVIVNKGTGSSPGIDLPD